ncbi:hypothetical protein NIES3585_50470 [Nodularia sp. NIES-3585]|nr:hypothetical protein NIES3585_50470 [Nodularia sp. NIES-3585]
MFVIFLSIYWELLGTVGKYWEILGDKMLRQDFTHNSNIFPKKNRGFSGETIENS